MRTIDRKVLIIGSGAAGVMTGIKLSEHDVDCVAVSKREEGDAHTVWAAGGINASLGNLDPEDSWEIHAADTIEEGHYINDYTAVENVCKTMPSIISLLEEWGMEFNRTKDGLINQRYFGAQSYRRTCYNGDRTGEELLETLVSKVVETDADCMDEVMITDIIRENDRVVGALGFDMNTGEKILFNCDHIVLAAGGAAGIYNRSTSRRNENNGDGLILGYEVGADIMDIEFIQFHPTGIKTDDNYWNGKLVTEAVRGEGGKLYNSKGERFMEEYSPQMMELDARDVVARAIYNEVQEGRGVDGGVKLDISHRSEEFINEKLPRMKDRFEKLGIDITEEPMIVAPTSHYSMGGISVDFNTGETGVKGLYSVGENTAGVHGANRLGGNSLAETVSIASLLGDHLGSKINNNEVVSKEPSIENTRLERVSNLDGSFKPDYFIDRIGEILWEKGGVIRNKETLNSAYEEISKLDLDSMYVDGPRSSKEFEKAVYATFTKKTAMLMLKSAIKRKESRGAHYREDYPEKKSGMRGNYVDNKFSGLEFREKGEMPDSILEVIKEKDDLEYHHLE